LEKWFKETDVFIYERGVKLTLINYDVNYRDKVPGDPCCFVSNIYLLPVLPFYSDGKTKLLGQTSILSDAEIFNSLIIDSEISKSICLENSTIENAKIDALRVSCNSNREERIISNSTIVGANKYKTLNIHLSSEKDYLIVRNSKIFLTKEAHVLSGIFLEYNSVFRVENSEIILNEKQKISLKNSELEIKDSSVHADISIVNSLITNTKSKIQDSNIYGKVNGGSFSLFNVTSYGYLNFGISAKDAILNECSISQDACLEVSSSMFFSMAKTILKDNSHIKIGKTSENITIYMCNFYNNSKYISSSSFLDVSYSNFYDNAVAEDCPVSKSDLRNDAKVYCSKIENSKILGRATIGYDIFGKKLKNYFAQKIIVKNREICDNFDIFAVSTNHRCFLCDRGTEYEISSSLVETIDMHFCLDFAYNSSRPKSDVYKIFETTGANCDELIDRSKKLIINQLKKKIIINFDVENFVHFLIMFGLIRFFEICSKKEKSEEDDRYILDVKNQFAKMGIIDIANNVFVRYINPIIIPKEFLDIDFFGKEVFDKNTKNFILL
jgi:hypothetical protein